MVTNVQSYEIEASEQFGKFLLENILGVYKTDRQFLVRVINPWD